MIQALFQTISSFFIDIPSISDLLSNIGNGKTDLFGGVVSLLAGLFKKGDQ